MHKEEEEEEEDRHFGKRRGNIYSLLMKRKKLVCKHGNRYA